MDCWFVWCLFRISREQSVLQAGAQAKLSRWSILSGSVWFVCNRQRSDCCIWCRVNCLLCWRGCSLALSAKSWLDGGFSSMLMSLVISVGQMLTLWLLSGSASFLPHVRIKHEIISNYMGWLTLSSHPSLHRQAVQAHCWDGNCATCWRILELLSDSSMVNLRSQPN